MAMSRSHRSIPICRHFGDGSADFKNNIRTLKEDLVTKFLGSNLHKNMAQDPSTRTELHKLTGRARGTQAEHIQHNYEYVTIDTLEKKKSDV